MEAFLAYITLKQWCGRYRLLVISSGLRLLEEEEGDLMNKISPVQPRFRMQAQEPKSSHKNKRVSTAAA